MVTNATACPNPNYPDTAFCQAAPGYDGTSLSQYSAANSTWYVTPDGTEVVQTMQDGTPCGNFDRETTIVYVCDSTAITARMINATEVRTLCLHSR